ncbi:MAG: hypothetical protein H6721_30730 [Sandaracinus sp.]|nr:hypothetical protein [Sandaracinus sp.]
MDGREHRPVVRRVDEDQIGRDGGVVFRERDDRGRDVLAGLQQRVVCLERGPQHLVDPRGVELVAVGVVTIDRVAPLLVRAAQPLGV